MQRLRHPPIRLLVAAAAVLAFVLGVGGTLLVRSLGRTTSPSPRVEFVTFVDPNGFYTMDVPRAWKFRHFDQEGVADGVPQNANGESIFAQRADGQGITVFIGVTVSPDQRARHESRCAIPPANQGRPNATVDGIPAEYIPAIHNGRELYAFSTEKADYQISYRSSLFDGAKLATADEQAIYHHMIASFRPTPSSPFTC